MLRSKVKDIFKVAICLSILVSACEGVSTTGTDNYPSEDVASDVSTVNSEPVSVTYRKPRNALVIGNASYGEAEDLNNPLNDAIDMS